MIQQQQQVTVTESQTLPRLYCLIFIKDWDFVEVSLGLFMAVWGVWLIAPWATFPASVGYTAMIAVMSEDHWAWMLMSLGSLRLWAYFEDYWMTRVVLTFIALTVWYALAFLFLYSNPIGTGWLVYMFFALNTTWVFWRIIVAGARRASE